MVKNFVLCLNHEFITDCDITYQEEILMFSKFVFNSGNILKSNCSVLSY